MTKAEAIERLENDCCKSRVYCELYPDACMKEECEIYMAIEALKERPTGNWIPCSERLPEREGRYLCTNDELGGWIISINIWFGDHWLYPDKKPIAWMPLPEPWKGENDE